MSDSIPVTWPRQRHRPTLPRARLSLPRTAAADFRSVHYIHTLIIYPRLQFPLPRPVHLAFNVLIFHNP